MSDLKPCPFCGSDRVYGTKARNGVYRVECWCCGASVESVYGIEKAIKWWNTRAIDRDELLAVADSLDSGWAQFHDDILECEDVDTYEREKAEQIRKAVGA